MKVHFCASVDSPKTVCGHRAHNDMPLVFGDKRLWSQMRGFIPGIERMRDMCCVNCATAVQKSERDERQVAT